VAKSIIEHSRKVFLAADNSKFDRKAMVRLGNIAQADMLFTDKPPNEHIISVMNEHDVVLQVCR
jgi:DeoR family glycerol-3-phosphate regulon repressor